MFVMQFVRQIATSIIPVVAGIEIPRSDRGERL